MNRFYFTVFFDVVLRVLIDRCRNFRESCCSVFNLYPEGESSEIVLAKFNIHRSVHR